MPEPIPATQPAPNVTIGSNVPVATALRTGAQGLSGVFIVDFVEAFNLYDFTERQYGLAATLVGMVLAYIQNLLEKRRGRKYIGAAPEGATRPEGGHVDLATALLATAVAVLVYLIMAKVFKV